MYGFNKVKMKCETDVRVIWAYLKKYISRTSTFSRVNKTEVTIIGLLVIILIGFIGFLASKIN